MMAQFTQDQSLRKHPQLNQEFKHFSHAKDLVNTEGQEWKIWRRIFSPGFATANLMSLVPQMIEEILVFKACLEEAAQSNETVTLEPKAARLAFDVIGRAVL